MSTLRLNIAVIRRCWEPMGGYGTHIKRALPPTVMGLTLAIDDFGTGYSSFNSLKQFRVSRLKIDRSFIRDVAANPDDAAITAAIISMAKSLHLKVIAEGVENEAQMTFLRAHHCDEIQGYYFSKPLAVDKVSDKLRGDTLEPKVRVQASGKQS